MALFMVVMGRWHFVWCCCEGSPRTKFLTGRVLTCTQSGQTGLASSSITANPHPGTPPSTAGSAKCAKRSSLKTRRGETGDGRSEMGHGGEEWSTQDQGTFANTSARRSFATIGQ